MKRVILISSILSLLIVSFISAATPSDLIEGKTGINPETFSDPEQLKEEYLQKNWAELISKNKLLGPIHNFLLNISPIFRVLFGEPYSLSLLLLFIIVLWIVTARLSYVLLGMTPLNNLTNLVLALGVAVIAAQMKLLRLIGASITELILSKDAWWMRLIVILAIIVVVFVINYGAKLLAQMERKAKQQGKELTLKQKVDETAAFIKGVKKGQKITGN